MVLEDSCGTSALILNHVKLTVYFLMLRKAVILLRLLSDIRFSFNAFLSVIFLQNAFDIPRKTVVSRPLLKDR